MILIDTGPLVALFDKNDACHALCKKELASIKEPLLTTQPVLTEVMYLLGFSSKAQDLCFSFIQSEAVGIETELNLERIQELMKRYENVPMDFADASLVATSEDKNISHVFTIDHKDFHIYKPKHLRCYQILPETLKI